MNSLTARNAGFFLIIYLLWVVFSGIYENQFNQKSVQTTDLSSNQNPVTQRRIQSTPATSTSTSTQNGATKNSTNRLPTAEEIQQIMMTRKLPSWAKGSEKKTLSLDELEEIQSSGVLPDQ